jgi:hypothetical protein
MNYDLNDCQYFSFITPLFSDVCKHTKNKSWRRCRLYFQGRMQCWWIFDFETDYRSRWYRAIENKKIEMGMIITLQLAARKNLIQMSLQ